MSWDESECREDQAGHNIPAAKEETIQLAVQKGCHGDDSGTW